MKNVVILFLSLFFVKSFSQKINEEKILELESVGYTIDSTLFTKKGEYFDAVYDMKSMANRFLMKSEDSEIQSFNSSFYNGFSQSFSMGNEIIKSINAGSEYTFLRAYASEGKYYLLFRLYGEQGLNYHSHLVKYISGKPRIIDTYVYLSGEYISQTIKAVYDVSVNNLNPLKRLLNNSEVEDINTMLSIKKALEAQKYKDVITLYESLTKTSKNKKLYNILVLTAAQHLSEDVYSKYINAYESKFPNDASLYLISIDGFILREDYDIALQTINKLDTAIGKDDFLNNLRGNIYYLKKDYKNAILSFNIITRNYPMFFEAYDSLLTVYIESNKYKEAVTILDIMVDRFEISKGGLEELVIENFKIFSNSTQFKNWINK